MSDQEALVSSDKTENVSQKIIASYKGWISCRHIMALFSFLGFVNVYAMRVNLSVALVAMVNASYSKDNDTSNECPNPNANTTKQLNTGEFNWDSNTQNLILAAFFYGYIVTQIPGGWMAEKFGAKLVYGLGVLCTSILTLITPLAARTSVGLFVAVRILEGIGEGVTFPAMHALLSKWAPPMERSQLGSFIYSGAQLGTVISLPISGILCQSTFLGGWPSVFYIFGTVGLIWFIAWIVFVYDSPGKHPRISIEECLFLEQTIGDASTKQRPAVPWFSIFLSVPFWALITAHFCNNWGFYTLLTNMPRYMKIVLRFNISENGFLSALPYLTQLILMFLSGVVADLLRRRQILSTTIVRKLANGIGLMGPGIFLVVISFIGCSRSAAVICLTLSVGLGGIASAGFQVNHLDLAPAFAGTLLGITNSIATIPGFAGPAVVTAFTEHNNSVQQWQKVFFISAGIYAFGSLTYAIFGSGVEQPWSIAKKNKDENIDQGPLLEDSEQD
ncbi:DgyrCDS8396 [Dimorphilus gyrociliatus]|uniref:Sialin n=1 Tax=Dimorphilus gyrociliatus TaxID=2664684 RepID=A0A7I8VU41_9ANNE|nr:DgyrCDS8396 [Dimorphilus gyrociliatus]